MMARRMAFRFFLPLCLVSLVLLIVSMAMAVVLFRQRAGMSESLHENITSRRVAADLEEDLITLAGHLHGRPEDREVINRLHQRIDTNLATVLQHANQDVERVLAGEIQAAYARYRQGWPLPPANTPPYEAAVQALTRILEQEAVAKSRSLERYNSLRIEESAEEHRVGLRFLAWGMVIVGTAGAAAGVLLGYATARTVARSVRRLQISVRDAAGKLGQKFPEIVLTQEGTLDRLQQETDSLVEQVGLVVQKLQQREREVLRAEQLAAVGQLAAGVAHEIRNPLTSIKMLVQLARQENPKLPDDDLEVIEREVRRMERSLNTFLDFARPPKPNREWVELGELVEQTLNLVRGRASKQHVAMTFPHPPRPVEFHGDPEKLRQVLVNLVLNALDAMPTGGTLEVRLEQKAEGAIRIAVTDTGAGIDPVVMPRLFQPFVSHKETGLGLGLVTSRRIVEDHGGTLTAASPFGRGAVFTIQLPASEPRD